MDLKKWLTLLVCAALCLFAGCSSGGDQVDAVTDPESTAPDVLATEEPVKPGADPMQDELLDATLPPDPASYTYSELNDGTVTMAYPSDWQRIPGSSTICFVQPVSDGAIPARVTLTKKSLSKSVTDKIKASEFESYFDNVLADIEFKEVGDLQTEQSFMGDDAACAITYTAEKDGHRYKGYAIMAGGGKTICVFHFRCAEGQFNSMSVVLERIKNSISIVQTE